MAEKNVRNNEREREREFKMNVGNGKRRH